jgi:hypothetical protein
MEKVVKMCLDSYRSVLFLEQRFSHFFDVALLPTNADRRVRAHRVRLAVPRGAEKQ